MAATSTARTRRALHGIAELLMAGPQYRTSGTIKLQVCPDGFRTRAEPLLRLVGGEVESGSLHLAVNGRTVTELARACGVLPGPPEGLYPDGSGLGPADALVVDEAELSAILRAFALGDAALRSLDPTGDPVLWPEHFDVGLVLGEVGYGVSAGDAYLDEPYAYLSVTPRPDEPFFNAPFGAAAPMAGFAAAADVLAFFRTGQALTAR